MFHLDAWVRSLAALVLLAGIAELLLPTGTMKGYARAVLGLLVLLGVLQPVVAVVHGDLRLDLSGPLAGPGAAAGHGRSAVSAEAASAEAAAVRAYEQLVAGQVARIARQVPGVLTASATLRFGAVAPGAVPPVEAVSVQVTPTAAGLAAGEALGRQVQLAVARGLGIDPAAVAVQVG
jgi:stage III sporulation protein AF